MLSCRNNTFWLQNPLQLICDWSLIPVNQMTFEQKMNAITRLSIFIFIITILFGIKISLIFLALSLLIIIIVYYSLRKKTQVNIQENFRSFNKEMTSSINQNLIGQNLQRWPKPELNYSGFVDPSNCLSCNRGTNLDGMTPIFERQTTVLPQKPHPPTRVYPPIKIMETVPQGQPTIKGVYNNPEYISNNQKLVGPANPRTKIAPVVAPPILDDQWKASNLVVRPQINKQTAFDNYLSGYEISTECAPPTQLYTRVTHNKDENLQELIMSDIYDYQECNIRNQLPFVKTEKDDCIENYEDEYTNDETDKKENIINEDEDHSGYEICGEKNKKCYPQKKYTKTDLYDGNVNFDFPYIIVPKNELKDNNIVTPIQKGSVNIACGYNPKQLIESKIPANLNSGPAAKKCQMAEYNNNIFTQTIQPGVYTTNQVNEPINSNIGISFNQQFEPTVVTNNKQGGINFTEIDPNIIEPELCSVDPPYIQTDATEWNVTDPRFTGYGTSYRSYNNNLLGQTNFYYDDVNAIRMPNYLVRSKIDTQPFADSYGPLPAGGEYGNKDNSIIRGLANGAFLDDSIQFRTELQQRLMRKANSRSWQLREAPIYAGGMGSV
tara:strand:- start:12 stop:1832 length:1821 start_codon:yes stop_codon:yes gene_type:complete